jgi:hypothetical protein
MTDRELPDWLIGRKWALPVRSPDMHKVIEHFFHRLKVDFNVAVLRYPGRLDPIKAQTLLRKVVAKMRAADISKDVKSLPLTYHAIAADKGSVFRVGGREVKGSGGGWPESRLR